HPAGLADRFEVVLGIAGFADGRAAVDMHLADLARAQAELRIRAFARQHLHVRARGACELRPFAGEHLDAVHLGADRDVAQRQRIARLDRRLGPRHELGADRHAFRRDHVAALAVGVEQQRDVRAAVRVVLEALDLGRDAVLVAAEIDQAQVMLVAAALVTRRHATVVVAAAAALFRLGERPERVALVQLGVDDRAQRTPAGRSRFYFYQWHRLLRRREIDFLALGETHVGLLPAALAADGLAEAPLFALDVQHRHRVDLGLEHQLDRGLDLGLGRAVGDAEHVLAELVGDEGAFLRHHRREHHGHQLIDGVFLHLSSSSSFATALLVISTRAERTSASGLALRTDITCTFVRLREESIRFWSSSSVSTSTSSKPSAFTFCASILVFGASTLNSSTTRRRSSRASCDRIDAMPARYILRLTLWEKFSSGEFGKILPPPRQSGLEVMPARAQPVPFCRQGFLVEWLTAPRSFCAREPMRAFAWNAMTTWCTSASL